MKSKLRRIGYFVASLGLFLLFTYLCFTWGNVQG